MTGSPPAKLDRTVLLATAALIVGALAVIFDSTIISLALHSLATAFDVGVSTIQWVTTGYLLALAAAIPVVGWAQARFGGKRVWMVALTVFLLASIACSLAWDASSLIAFRVIQGFGGGLMLPLMATLTVQQLPDGQGLGRLMAAVSLPAALGPILGPTIGGLILTWLDWPWLFWVNVPFCLVGLWLADRFVPDDHPTGRPTLDWVGLLMVCPGLVGVLFGLSNITQDGGASRLDFWAPLVAGLALLAVFALTQLRRPTTALVDLSLLRRPTLAASSAALFLSGTALYGSMLLLPLYFQVVRGTDALTAALLLIPQGVGALVSRTLAGRLTDSIGARAVAIGGFVLTGLATIPFALAGTDTNQWWLLAVLFVRGIGTGAVLIPAMSVAYVGLAKPDVPHASIITRLFQQLGGAFGTAVLAVVLEGAATGAATLAGYAAAFDVAFWWAAAVTLLAVVVCAWLPAASTPAPSAAPGIETDEPVTPG